jgi:hypothetical protein
MGFFIKKGMHALYQAGVFFLLVIHHEQEKFTQGLKWPV